MADASRPLLTYYDDANGERVELSVATTANWVAKTASLLVDGLGRAPGDRLVLLLPMHWQAAVALLGGWAAGLCLHLDTDPAGAEVVFAEAEELPAALESGADDVVGLSLSLLGEPLADVPLGVVDYATEVRAYPDVFAALPTAGPALEAGEARYDATQLVALAETRAAESNLGPGSTVLTVAPYTTLDALLAGLLAPLAAGARVVLCRRLDATRLPDRLAAERVTATVGLDVPGLPRLWG